MADYRDCVVAAARFLGLDNIVSTLEKREEQDADENEKKEIDMLLGCARFVVHEIASEYIPLICAESVVAKDGFVQYSALKNPATDVASVKVGNKKRRFKLLHDKIAVDGAFNGEVLVEYSYPPKTGNLGDKLEWSGDRVSARLVGYGIACEYCIINGMSEAVLWDKRYKDALTAAKRTKGEVRVRKRSWI